MNETDASKITWRRRGVGPIYVGAVSHSPEAVRLTGRDPVSGIDVALSIPIGEIEHVGVADAVDRSREGDGCVVLDLAESEAIELRPVGVVPSHVQLLARALGALAPASAVLAQGGRT
jgi:hypothetical protein